jgi:hypothetical protein
VKENLLPSAFNLIDWNGIRDATTMAPDLFNLWMTEQVSEWPLCHWENDEVLEVLGGKWLP